MDLDFSKEALPLYVQLKTRIKNAIIDGAYPYGAQIPSEIEYEKKYGVSRITVRRAISDLEKEGYVVRSRGKGTHVIYNHTIKESFSRIRSFTEEMKAAHLEPGTSFVEVKEEAVPSDGATAFGIEPGTRLVCVSRVRTANHRPIVCFKTYFAKGLNAPLDPEVYGESLYYWLNERGIRQPERALENFKAVNASKAIADKLEIRENDAVLVRTRFGYNKKNEMIEYTLAYYRGDTYSFTVELTA
nr:GntR family transcriptional regulator [uncultured Dubosiella sp.]